MKKTPALVACANCGTPTPKVSSWVSKYSCCSTKCRHENWARLSSERMARTNRKHAAARMKTNNPMHRGDNKARMQATLRAMGHQPSVRGGNGRGPTAAQAALAAVLGWPMEVAIPTGRPVGSGFPSSYKVDVGHPGFRVAVEVDGNSHQVLSRRAEDRKKEALLESIGWRVLRFSNAQVIADPSGCAAMVLKEVRS